MNKYVQILSKWSKEAKEDELNGIRQGQSLFNIAYDIAPEVADLLRGSNVDCFYDDVKISSFLSSLKKKLNDKK